jgi:ABC-2 type transport system ATP-binding protein
MQTAVRLEGVSVTIGKTPILSDISLALPHGHIIGLLGPSGAGKTTLIRAIIGRQHISGGAAEVLGELPTSSELRGHLGYMTQGAAFYDDLTTRQNLAYFAAMRGAPAVEVDEILQAVELSAQAKQLASTLSGGQRSRLSLAIALLGKPQLLLLDEPTVGVDPVLRQQLWKLFRQLSSDGTTVIISSHIMDEAELCDELVLLRDGHVLAQGSPRQLCEETQTGSVEEAFLQLAGGVS